MRRPPRAHDRRLLSANILLWGFVQGLLALAIVAAIYVVDVRAGAPDADVRELSFVALVLVNLALVLVNRSYGLDWLNPLKRGNVAFFWIGGAALSLIAVAVTWKPAENLFGFGAFHGHDLAIVLLAAAVMILVLEILKRFVRGRLVS